MLESMTSQPQPAAQDGASGPAPRAPRRGLDRTGPFALGDKVHMSVQEGKLTFTPEPVEVG